MLDKFRSPSRGRSLRILFLVLLSALCLAGCDCSEGDTTGAFGPRCGDDVTANGVDQAGNESDGTGVLLVSDVADSSIRRFNGVSTLEGSIELGISLAGGLTRLTRPQYLTIDPTSNELIVADEGTSAILFFNDVDALRGDLPPTRVLTGPATELVGPVQTFVDTEADELYVLDKALSRVLVFPRASTIEGDVVPIRRLGGPTSGITFPSSFIFRNNTEQLSVLNPTEIVTFESYRSVNGDPPPSGRFGGAATTFSNLAYGLLTDNGSLIVVDSGIDRILTFEDFQSDQFNRAPTRFVEGGNSRITEPRQFVLQGDTMYLANGGEVLVFADISQLDGNPFPTRRFSGLNPNTQTLTGMVLR